MPKSRMPTWVSLIFLGVGLLVVGIPGLFVYMRVTATKVHRDSQEIPSVMESPPPAKWAGAAEQARQIVRTSISENNLAGLSIAVGIDGEIVWTEGFGFAPLRKHAHKQVDLATLRPRMPSRRERAIR
jgi:hypothetical protein